MTFGSLYSHGQLILTKSSKSKNQVVHKQELKDLISSMCITSSERRLLDLESEVMEAQVLFLLRATIYHWIFLFSRSKDKNANIGILYSL